MVRRYATAKGLIVAIPLRRSWSRSVDHCGQARRRGRRGRGRSSPKGDTSDDCGAILLVFPNRLNTYCSIKQYCVSSLVVEKLGGLPWDARLRVEAYGRRSTRHEYRLENGIVGSGER